MCEGAIEWPVAMGEVTIYVAINPIWEHFYGFIIMVFIDCTFIGPLLKPGMDRTKIHFACT